MINGKLNGLVTGVSCLILAVAWGAGCAQPPKKKTPKPVPALKGIEIYAQAVEAYQRGDRDRAIATLNRALAVNPNLRMAQALLGDLYRTKGDYRSALGHYEVAAKLDPYSVSSNYNLGLVYQLLNRLQEAATAYLKALELNPRDFKSNMNLGTVYLALGKRDEAEQYLTKATELNPNSAQAWSNLGVAYDSRGKPAAAESAYRRSLELDSNSISTLQNLGSNLITQGKAAEAINVMRQVVQRSDTASAHKRYGDALALGKQFEQAVQQYDIALRIDPNYYPAMNDKANVLIRQYRAGLELDDEKVRTAVDLWRASLKSNPQQPRVVAAMKEWDKPQLFGK
ncbi:MAG: tetratricopeptide repeat protein [Tepidisphaeraceae bacterium]